MDGSGKRLDRGGIRYVGGKNLRGGSPEPTAGGGHDGEAASGPGDEGKPNPRNLAGKGAGERGADPLGGPGDENHRTPRAGRETGRRHGGIPQQSSEPKSMKSPVKPPFTPLQITLTASWEWSDSRWEQAISKSAMRASVLSSR